MKGQEDQEDPVVLVVPQGLLGLLDRKTYIKVNKNVRNL